MVAQIFGDPSGELPDGWRVDRDNWGYRPIRRGDDESVTMLIDKSPLAPSQHWGTAFRENGRVYVMFASTALWIDARSTK